MSKRSVVLVVLVLTMLAALAVPGVAKPPAASTEAVSVTGVDLVGYDILPDGRNFKGAVIGGLSGLTYDPTKNLYYVISDDKSEVAPARYYTIKLHVNTKAASPVHVQFNDVTYIYEGGTLYPEGSIDLEGIERYSSSEMFISNERDSNGDPSVLLLDPLNTVSEHLDIPDYYIPSYAGDVQTSGVYSNLAFESLTLTPDHETLVTATEASLFQDGTPSTQEHGSNARVLEFSASDSFAPSAEYVYPVGPIPKGTLDDGGDNGLSEMIALDNAGTFLAMERSYVGGFGNTIRLYETSTAGATDVSGWFTIQGKSYTPMSKDLIVDLEDDLGLVPGETIDNMEGMALGPYLPDGRRILLLVSDNNFNPKYQNTIFIVLAVTLEPAG